MKTVFSEQLLQFIWKFRYYQATTITTISGEAIQVLSTGVHNHDQGPDFLNARIRIGNTTWVGNVEMHLRSSDWNRHGHTGDVNYQNIILHVVWDHDESVSLDFPVLELENFVPKLLLEKYEQLMNSEQFIPCGSRINQVNNINWLSWQERLLAERLERKSKLFLQYWLESDKNWDTCLWWMLARGFGSKTNGLAFEQVARTIPLNLIAKHRGQVIQIEALLMGTCGLLDESFTDDYAIMLQKEYRFLQKKYQLKKSDITLHFLRMRPVNFPTIRLAQLAMLLHKKQRLFSLLLEQEDHHFWINELSVTANDYWHYHYRFDEVTHFKHKRLGNAMINNLLINTLVPALFAYGHLHQQEVYKQRALNWLEEIKAEQNQVVTGFKQLGLKPLTAFETQALLELKTQYCENKRCLACGVGVSILE